MMTPRKTVFILATAVVLDRASGGPAGNGVEAFGGPAAAVLPVRVGVGSRRGHLCRSKIGPMS